MVAKISVAVALLLLAVALPLVVSKLSKIHQSNSRANILVTIKNGTIKGYTGRASNNNTIYTFLKIPFAKPPLGSLRFKNPEHTDGWGGGILDGAQFPPACPQFLTGGALASEDCLYLNIYTSRAGNETDKPLAPVMVFMYGGGFALGSTSAYTGNRLLANDAVLVVPNYRVNIFGFLSTGDEVIPGNFGLKDQNLALRWVQENIKSFGGDPNRVTIFGESAGASSVMYHLLSPLSHGLFHGVIAQSGTVLSPWALDQNPMESAQRIANTLLCEETETSQQILDCLTELPVVNITTTFFYQMLEDLAKSSLAFRGNVPVVEQNLPGAFITQDPLKLLKEGTVPDVPVILGATSDEGAIIIGGFHFLSFGNPNVTDETIDNPEWLREDFMNQLLATFDLSPNGEGVPVEEIMALAYFPGKNRNNFTAITDGLVNMMSVIGMKGPIKKTADILSERLSNVYFYSFDYRSPNRRNSFWWYIFEIAVPIIGGIIPPFNHGVVHVDDLIYLFNLSFVLEDADELFSAMFCQLWGNFATFGTPTPDATSEYPVWPKYTWREPYYMSLDAPPVVRLDYTKQWTRHNLRNSQ